MNGNVLPTIVDPPRRCITFDLPDEPQHVAAFFGAILQLAYWFNWQRDEAHTGKDVAAVWQEVFNQASLNWLGHKCEPSEILGSGGCDCAMCCIEFRNGVLYQLDCGVWKPVDGQQAGTGPGGTQPGPGTPIPAPGDCQTYNVAIVAGKSWLIPTLVSSGDLLTASNFNGATTEFAPLGRWNAYDGQVFQLGASQGNQVHDSGSLDPTLFEGQVLYVIGSTYYDATVPFMVPGGINQEQVALILNYTPGSNFAGTLTLDLDVCNNQSGTFRHVFDFATTPATFQPWTGGFFTTPIGIYTPGSGWSDTFEIEAGVGYRVAAAQRNFPARTLTHLDQTFDLVPGHNDSGGSPGIQLFINGTLVASIPWSSEMSGTAQHLVWDGVFPGATNIGIFAGCGNQLGGVDPGGSGVVTGLVVEGISTDPF